MLPITGLHSHIFFDIFVSYNSKDFFFSAYEQKRCVLVCVCMCRGEDGGRVNDEITSIKLLRILCNAYVANELLINTQ